jgi:hypothetical protein
MTTNLMKFRIHDETGDTCELIDKSDAEAMTRAKAMLDELVADHTRFASHKLADGAQVKSNEFNPNATETVVHRRVVGG